MDVEAVYTERLAGYRLSADHPLRPERFTLTMALAQEWGLLGGGLESAGTLAAAPAAYVVEPVPATDAELLRVHAPEYVAAVKRAGAEPREWPGGFGIGPGDTPAFAGMHEASALAAGATLRGLADVLCGAIGRAFCPAGGLHHAHADHASGFCVYNDLAVAIASALAADPALRIAYVDVDAHHGDGVQAAFYERPEVLTISLHESGQYLFPGTGRAVETGAGAGAGFALNLPLVPGADDACYELALARLVAPALRAFHPDVIVAQLGADSHRDDPLTHLATTVRGQHANAKRLVALSEELCGGRIVATGGGGYDTFSAVPRAWACALAALLGVEPPAELPGDWRELARDAAERAGLLGFEAPTATFAERVTAPRGLPPDEALAETERSVERLLAEHPLFA